MKSLYNRASVRKFSLKEVEDEKLEKILEAAIRASNTGNMQLYSIIVTTDQSLKNELSEKAHFNQAMVKEAPIVLTFCADLRRFTDWCNLRNADPGYDNFVTFYTATIDATIAAQNACVAAEELGLGICYVGTTNYLAEPIIDILNLPELVLPVTTVVLGYAENQPELTDRLPMAAVVHNETYSEFSDADIEELYAEKENLESMKDYVKQNEVENLAQVFTQKRYPTQNNKVFSQSLLKIIKEQGFMNND